MGGVVENVASAVSNFSDQAGTSVGGALGIPKQYRQGLGDIGTGLVTGAGPFAGSVARTTGEQMKTPEAPTAPGISQGVSDIQQAQNDQYNQYQENLPKMQQQMQEGLTKQANIGVAQGQRSVQEQNSKRGMGYGGVNEGQKQQVAAQGQQQLAGQLAQGNQGLLNMGNEIQAGGMQTGLGIQGQMQQQQNAIYQQALARQQSQNQMVGSGLGLLGSAGLMAI
jgi:hypothetical protein